MKDILSHSQQFFNYFVFLLFFMNHSHLASRLERPFNLCAEGREEEKRKEEKEVLRVRVKVQNSQSFKYQENFVLCDDSLVLDGFC